MCFVFLGMKASLKNASTCTFRSIWEIKCLALKKIANELLKTKPSFVSYIYFIVVTSFFAICTHQTCTPQ